MVFEKHDSIFLKENGEKVYYMNFLDDVYDECSLRNAIENGKIYVRRIDYEKDSDEKIVIKTFEDFKKYFKMYIERLEKELVELKEFIK